MSRDTRSWTHAAALLGLKVVPVAGVGGGGGPAARFTGAEGSCVPSISIGQHARVVVNGESLEMNAVLRGSGTRTMGGGWAWWTTGY